MKAVILAGGRGTRLGNLTNSIPKPMIKVGGIPILEHQINLLKKYKFNHVVICSGYLSEKIEEYFLNGKKWGVEIVYSKEDKPLGSAGCIKEAQNFLGKEFLVIYGDILINMNFDYLIAFHKEKKSCATLVVHPNDHPYDSDLVDVDEEMKILNFFSKPHPNGFVYRNLVNAGVYVLKDAVFKYIEKGKKCDFGKDIFPLMLKREEKMYAYNTPEYIKDMGTVERLREVKKDFKSSIFSSLNLSVARPALFLDRDGVINEEKGLLCSEKQVELIKNSALAIRKINRTKYLTVIITNQPAAAKGLCSIEDIIEVNKKLEFLLGKEGAKIDRIYFCPHHPEKGFPGENLQYKIECECRKPKTGMIEKAKKDLNIDVKNSFLIGDMTADIMTAVNANIPSIGVRSGYGCRDGKYDVTPDIWADDLYNAVEIIIDFERFKKFYEIIFEKIKVARKFNSKTPFIITVGGVARSGKSIFAFFLKRYLEENGLRSLIINMDDWILPVEKRKQEQNVIDRFRVKKFEKDFLRIINGSSIEIKKYDSFTRSYKSLNEKKVYNLGLNDVVIVEGVCALNSDILDKLSNFKVFMEIDDSTYKKRFYNFYRWKKLDEENINRLYNQRLKDEIPVVLKDKFRANQIIRGQG